MNLVTWFSENKDSDSLIVFFNDEVNIYTGQCCDFYKLHSQIDDLIKIEILPEELFIKIGKRMERIHLYRDSKFNYLPIKRITKPIIDMLMSNDEIVIKMGIMLTQ